MILDRLGGDFVIHRSHGETIDLLDNGIGLLTFLIFATFLLIELDKFVISIFFIKTLLLCGPCFLHTHLFS
jgi:hypothetical protein